MNIDEIDWERIEEAAFAILCLTLHGGRVWKGLDWDLMDRLHQRGWILDPHNKAKSVVVTEEGDRLAEALLREHFGKNSATSTAGSGSTWSAAPRRTVSRTP